MFIIFAVRRSPVRNRLRGSRERASGCSSPSDVSETRSCASRGVGQHSLLHNWNLVPSPILSSCVFRSSLVFMLIISVSRRSALRHMHGMAMTSESSF